MMSIVASIYSYNDVKPTQATTKKEYCYINPDGESEFPGGCGDTKKECENLGDRIQLGSPPCEKDKFGGKNK